MAESNTVTVGRDGPLHVIGDLRIGDAAESEVWLCRCGRSANKPFCDGSHNGAFTDPGGVGEMKGKCDGPGGALSVKPARNGPLLLQGNFEIVGADGEVAWRGKKAALCRCGASANKPFCDGNHKGCGFEAD